jgi:hypothetical protein
MYLNCDLVSVLKYAKPSFETLKNAMLRNLTSLTTRENALFFSRLTEQICAFEQ